MKIVKPYLKGYLIRIKTNFFYFKKKLPEFYLMVNFEPILKDFHRHFHLFVPKPNPIDDRKIQMNQQWEQLVVVFPTGNHKDFDELYSLLQFLPNSRP